MQLTQEQLKLLLPKNPYLPQWYNALSQLLPEYGIDTPERIAAFISQCSHESMGFTVLQENLNYRWQTLRRLFSRYFPTDEIAKQYATRPNRQEAIANRIYANRMGNGPESSGDGWKHRGRGLIQLTGKDNYSAFAESLEISIDEAIDYLTTFEGAVQSACWFWETNNLNYWVDIGDFDGLSDSINIGRKTKKYGDSIGFADRLNHYRHALEIVKV